MLVIEKGNEREEVALLLKFGRKKHINSLRDGNISVNNIDTYVKQELESGKAGIGDKHDGATIISDVTITDIYMGSSEEKYNDIINRILDDIVKNKFKTTFTIHREEDKRTPIFCAIGIRKSELERRDGKLIFKFSKDEINKLKEDFKEYTDVFIVSAGIFSDKILKQARQKNIMVNMDQIKYYDENVNESKRINDSMNSNIIFWKKNCFSNQREFRIAFPGVFIDERTDLLNIGSLKDISLVLRKNTVLNEKFELELTERT